MIERNLDVKKYKQKLVMLKEQVTHTIKGTREGVKDSEDSKGYSQHHADEGTDDFDKTIRLEVSNK